MSKRQKISSYFKVSSSRIDSDSEHIPIPTVENNIVAADSVSISESDGRGGETSNTEGKNSDYDFEFCMCSLCSKQATSARNNKAYQPLEFDYLSTVKKDSHHSRSFQKKWFEDFKWLSFCTNRKAAFCNICQWSNCHSSFKKSNSDLAFVSTGFTAWKRALETFRNHEKSKSHLQSIMDMHVFKQPVNVCSMITDRHREEQIARKKVFLKIITSVGYLARQGLALRGHDEQESNFMQLLKVRCEDDPGILKWINDKKYLSHDIVNELLQHLYNRLIRRIICSVQQSKWFSLIADETTDCSHHEQFCIAIRWVSPEYEIHEDLIGIVDVPNTTAETLTSMILDLLIRCGLDIKNCRGQAYDGASNMTGRLNGVATRVKSITPAAVSIHCVAHSLQLCLQDATAASIPIRNALNIASDLHNLIKISPKRSAFFQAIANDFNSGDITTLKPICGTRWTVRNKALQSIINNYEILEEVLAHISEERSEPGRRANGLQALMQQFSSYFGLQLALDIFSVTEHCSKQLQKSTITASETNQIITLLKETLQKKRDKFDEIYKKICETALKLHSLEPTLPRQRKIPKRLDHAGNETSHVFVTAKDYYRQRFYETYDLVINELNRRFCKQTLTMLGEIEKLLISAFNSIQGDLQISNAILQLYSEDIDAEKLKIQLQMLPGLLQTYTDDHSAIEVESMKDVICIFKNTKFAQSMFPDIHNLVRLYLVVPMTSVTAERSFSALKRLKTYIRSTMTQSRLNHLLLLHCHKNILDEILKNPAEIAEDFISSSCRRMDYFGK